MLVFFHADLSGFSFANPITHLVIDIIMNYRPHVTKISVTSILKVEPGSWSTFIDTYTTIN